jgi:dTMP kinase
MFVVFEGIDGSGKTTVSNKVAEKLRDSGLSVEHLREGGKFSSPVTQAIREFGRDSRNLDLTPHAEFFLYVLRDVQLLDEMTRPALERAEVVIADRFLYSAEILSSYGRGLPTEWMKPVLDAAARGLKPDLVIVIDVDPHVARARRRVSKIVTVDKRPPSRKGLAGVGIQQRFRAGYRDMAAKNTDRWVLVDNDRDLNETVEYVYKIVQTAATKGVAAALELAKREAPPAKKPAPAMSTPQEALTHFLAIVDRRAETEPQVAAYLLSGLYGPGIDERRKALAERAPETILSGLNGLTDPVSWELRERLSAKFPARVARSLGGLARIHPKAAPLRAELSKTAPVDVLAALDTIDSDEAWALRDRLYAEAPEVVIGSLDRIGTPRAWALREKFIADRGGEAAALAVYETAKAICKSITGLDDERSWELRKAAREAAPVAALASVKYLNSERSWKWRARYLERAQKVVFDTLARVDDPRAWEMREKLASQCKEAIDSLNELDGATAWRLREQYADVWPSTVVKTLGALTVTPQGRALVERQLRKYPDNLSLLKHAAAIAVGAHIDPELVTE